MKKKAETGEQREIRRHMIVTDAVRAADRIILDGSDGSEEETNYLTLCVAKAMFNKVDIALSSRLLRRDYLPSVQVRKDG